MTRTLVVAGAIALAAGIAAVSAGSLTHGPAESAMTAHDMSFTSTVTAEDNRGNRVFIRQGNDNPTPFGWSGFSNNHVLQMGYQSENAILYGLGEAETK